jgi:hypothetical protein
MSVINLIAALFYPDYPEAYLVEVGILAEARSRGGEFHEVVGRVVKSESSFEVWSQDGFFHAMREVAFGKGTDKENAGYVQVHLPIRQSKAPHSESKIMSVIRVIPPRERKSA